MSPHLSSLQKLARSLRRPARARRARNGRDKLRLAYELLGTLSTQVLAETGHLKPHYRAAYVRARAVH